MHKLFKSELPEKNLCKKRWIRPELESTYDFLHTNLSSSEALPFPHGLDEVIALFLFKIKPKEYTPIFGEMKMGYSRVPIYHAWNKHVSGIHVDLAARCVGHDIIKIFKPHEGIYWFDENKQARLRKEKWPQHEAEVMHLIQKYKKVHKFEDETDVA